MHCCDLCRGLSWDTLWFHPILWLPWEMGSGFVLVLAALELLQGQIGVSNGEQIKLEV